MTISLKSILVALFLMPVTIAFGRPSEVMTVEGGVVCFSPFNLRQGIVAANHNDQKWLREIGCVKMRGGIRTILIDPNAGLGEPWQVRLYPGKDSDGVTGWGYAPSFQTKAGKPFWRH